MNRFFFLFALAATLLFGFTSCETNADVDLPEYPAKLVVNGFITPQDTVIQVRVSKSLPIFQSGGNSQNPYASITDAVVRIFGNSTSVTLVYNSIADRYEVSASQFAIIAGNTYKVTVTAPGGFSAEAETTVPLFSPTTFAMSHVSTVDTTSNPGFFAITSDIDYSYTDQPGVQNLYSVNSCLILYDSQLGDTSSVVLSTSLQNDDGKDGTVLTGSQAFSSSFYFQQGATPVGIRSYLIHASLEYYEFHRSVYTGNFGGDPFSEPSLVYSNVTNGYGVFAGANMVIRYQPF